MKNIMCYVIDAIVIHVKFNVYILWQCGFLTQFNVRQGESEVRQSKSNKLMQYNTSILFSKQIDVLFSMKISMLCIYHQQLKLVIITQIKIDMFFKIQCNYLKCSYSMGLIEYTSINFFSQISLKIEKKGCISDRVPTL